MRQSAEADFSEFAAASSRELRRTAYLMCADWQRAEDATQDALLKVYLNWSRLERRGGLRAYSRRVLVSCVIDQGRRPWRRERPVDELPDGVVVAARAEHSIDDRDAVMAALARLPVRQRVCATAHPAAAERRRLTAMVTPRPKPQSEPDVPADPGVAESRVTGGDPGADGPDAPSTTGTGESEEFVGRTSGQDSGYAEETGAERRAAAEHP